ncbi:hypothetical protein I350_04136 [Cryptococcus amylolentus CBS 6273]|uniref:Solute carrier family 39 (Zinc transporter), member 9 n=1 Tax=Cryptococcus amylolentus CBS 6273 TaxID=1296118 RepID=A0A1E3K2T8_9TREE|nr:hypothetical protein I350_04136 [Cryptococcus amylolentus CBS 6273]
MPIATLLVQSGCMFAASFIVGSLPLWFKSATSGQRLQIVSVLGMGLLVGAALTIIIPEGVSTLYAALPQDGHDGNESAIHATGVSLLAGFSLMLLQSLIPHPPSPPPQATDFTYESPPSSPASSEPTPRPSAQHLNSSTPMISKPKRMSVDDSASEGAATVSAVHGLNATLGLVIHGAADGIALGASSLASSNSSLGLVVFLAVLIHKGPTALGLTTTLLSLSLPLSSIRRRLMIFSCAAPAGAIATFLLVSAFGSRSLGGSRNGGDPLGWWTGIALLFSGGSFLYVATVIQPISSATDSHAHSHSHHHPESGHGPEPSVEDRTLGKYQRTALLMGGMILPVFLSLFVEHSHS